MLSFRCTVVASATTMLVASSVSAEIERAYNMTGIHIANDGVVYGIVDCASFSGMFMGDGVYCDSIQCP